MQVPVLVSHAGDPAVRVDLDRAGDAATGRTIVEAASGGHQTLVLISGEDKDKNPA